LADPEETNPEEISGSLPTTTDIFSADDIAKIRKKIKDSLK